MRGVLVTDEDDCESAGHPMQYPDEERGVITCPCGAVYEVLETDA